MLSVPVLLFLVSGAFAQIPKCEGFDKKVTYRLLLDNITTRNSQSELYLRIYVKPERFTVDSMVKLIQRIKKEYCKFDRITVAIYDTRKLAKMPDPPPQPLSAWLGTPIRGFYEYEKRENKDELSFLEIKEGKRVDVEIYFKPDGFCRVESNSED